MIDNYCCGLRAFNTLLILSVPSNSSSYLSTTWYKNCFLTLPPSYLPIHLFFPLLWKNYGSLIICPSFSCLWLPIPLSFHSLVSELPRFPVFPSKFTDLRQTFNNFLLSVNDGVLWHDQVTCIAIGIKFSKSVHGAMCSIPMLWL